jgi:hypothetical protein
VRGSDLSKRFGSELGSPRSGNMTSLANGSERKMQLSTERIGLNSDGGSDGPMKLPNLTGRHKASLQQQEHDRR